MLELVDNIYVFSNARAYFGNVIAARTRSDHRKKNILSQFSLGESERSFLLREWSGGDKKLIAVVEARDGERVPIFFLRGFCGVAALGLAIEPLDCSPTTLCRYLFGFRGEVAISHEISAMVQAAFDAMMYGETEQRQYVNAVREAKSLCGIAPFVETALYDALTSVSLLTGTRIELSRSTDNQGKDGIAKPRFAGNEILAMLTIMALSARESSDDRTLYVETGFVDNMMRIEARFNTDKTDLEELCKDLSDIAEGIGMIHSKIKTDGAVRLCALPYVRDVSLVGLKAPDEIARARFYLG